MGDQNSNLYALLGSRICHDLISPIGAINNGLELLSMTSAGVTSPEMALIQESCRSASARIRFFRVAFGVASTEQRMGAGELRSILRDFTEGTRLTVSWNLQTDTSRTEAQLAYLAILCLETGLPQGGRIDIDESAGRWKLTAEADVIRYDAELWGDLPDGPMEVALDPALVHFCLMRDFAAAQGRRVEVHHSGTKLQLIV